DQRTLRHRGVEHVDQRLAQGPDRRSVLAAERGVPMARLVVGDDADVVPGLDLLDERDPDGMREGPPVREDHRHGADGCTRVARRILPDGDPLTAASFDDPVRTTVHDLARSHATSASWT